jgi:hypothetical protein
MTISFTKLYAAWKSGHLLDLEMPDGRALRNYTADDCLAYGEWLTGVGQRVRRGWGDGDDYFVGKTVGEVYDETTLRWWVLAFHERDLQSAPLRDERPAPGDEFDGGAFK